MKKLLILIVLMSACMPTMYGMQDELGLIEEMNLEGLVLQKISCKKIAVGSLAITAGTIAGLLGAVGVDCLYTKWGVWSPARGYNTSIFVARIYVALFSGIMFFAAFRGLILGFQKLKAGCCRDEVIFWRSID